MSVSIEPMGQAGLAKPCSQWTARAALLAITIVAIGLRVLWPGIAELKLDEVEPLTLADQIWSEHRLPATRGWTSTGLPGTPLVGYLLVLPRAVSPDPRLAVAFMGLLGGLGGLATYLVVRRFAGERLALLAAALYAVNPWAVFLSRKTWSEVQPLLAVLTLWAAYEVVVRRRPAWAWGFFAFAALQVQCHVVAVLYLPAMLLTVAMYWPRWRNRHTAAAVGLGALILLPYLVYLTGQVASAGYSIGQNRGAGLILDGRVLLYGLWFTSGATVTALLGRSVLLLRGWELALQGVNVLTAALLAGGLGLCGWEVIRGGKRRDSAALLLIWIVGPALPLLFLRGALGIHYLLILVPALYVLVAVAWERLLSSRNRAVALGSTLALLAVLGIQAGAVLAVYDGIRRYPAEGGFGRPLSLWVRVRQGVGEQLALDGESDLVVLGSDGDPRSDLPAVLNYLFRGRAHLRYVGQGGKAGLILPHTRSALTLALGVDEDVQRALDRYGGLIEQWTIPGDDWGVRLYRVRPYDSGDLAGSLTHPIAGDFDCGLRLLGARLPADVRPGERLTLITYWSGTGQTDIEGTVDTAFVHLLDRGGRRWTQDDGLALPRAEWRSDETLVQWSSLLLPEDLPPGDYTLYIGMYSWRDMSRAQLIGPDGRPAGDGIELGPVQVLER